MSVDTDPLPSSWEKTNAGRQGTATTTRSDSPTQDATETKPASSTLPLSGSYDVNRKSLLEMELEEEQEQKDDEHDSARNSSFRQWEEREQPSNASPKPFMSFREYHPEEWEQYYRNHSFFCNGGVIPLCQGQIEEQLELITQCRNPIEVLSLFHPHHDSHAEGVVEMSNSVHGAYIIPESCEYCGSESSKKCNAQCQRPKLFFLKKRPPFSPPGPEWDPKTDYAVVIDTKDTKSQTSDGSSSWMSGLFKGVVRRQKA